MKTKVAFIIGFIICAATAAAQQKVDQGKPGTQGPWPVTIMSILADGGSGGTTVVNQGTSPWVVSGTATVSLVTLADGGVVPAATKFFCNATKQSITPISTLDAGNVPEDGGLTGRWMIRVCNTSKNSGTPIIACTDDGQAPVMTSNTGVGETIEVGDCLTFFTPNTIRCVSDTLATGVTAEECN